ncbi:oligoribonuclease [Idiomarina piscisalsi]|jgi:oligoribonuclease|uniref:Oligoribonuclease n=1 Tax=Idiomarina piscisalsi TaxID=1096243 RepID=A0ABM6LQZ1_9GAMM|nr:oligoribonuclease [Idiomarina piscisalsi]ASG64927.1 oligoribonuclease [Idiomarina piscisalsi]
MAEDNKKQRLIWIDLEMTGLVPEEHHIIEVATIVTDAELNTIAEGPVIAVHQPKKYLDRMDAWNVKTHTGSGLVERVQKSQHNERTAAAATIEFLQQHIDAGVSPMCGNSICQDRRFLARHMPDLEAFFHYRNLDVSTLKELAKRWQPDVADSFKKSGAHEALADIRESIDELKHYRENFLRL